MRDHHDRPLTLLQVQDAFGQRGLSIGIEVGVRLIHHHHRGIAQQGSGEGDALLLGSGGAAGAIELDGAADSVKIKVFGGNGALVQTLDLGKQDAGLVRFAWDGKDASGVAQALGDYTFSATASAGASTVAATQFTLGSVLSVSLNESDMDVEIDGLGERGLNQIRQIF